MFKNIALLPAPAISPADEAAAAFLARYDGETRKLYAADLRIYFAWCAEQDLAPLDARRADLERFTEWMLTVRHNRAVSARRRLHCIKGFYALAHDDEVIRRDPTRMLRMPRMQRDPGRLVWLDRFQVGTMLHQAEMESPDHHALVALMSMLGLRVSAACRVTLEDCFTTPQGERKLRVQEKGDRVHVAPIPPALAEIIEAARGGRTEGPIVRKRNGAAQDRNGAYTWVRTLARKAGLPEKVHPHSLRRAAITVLIDSGMPIQDARDFAGHADIRTTERYHPTRGVRGVHGAFIAANEFATVA